MMQCKRILFLLTVDWIHFTSGITNPCLARSFKQQIIMCLTITSKSILSKHLPYEFIMISDEEEVNVACTVVTSIIVHYN